jgi:hypothetical protein
LWARRKRGKEIKEPVKKGHGPSPKREMPFIYYPRRKCFAIVYSHAMQWWGTYVHAYTSFCPVSICPDVAGPYKCIQAYMSVSTYLCARPHSSICMREGTVQNLEMNILYHVAALAIMLVDPWMSLPFMAMAHGQSLSPAGEPYALSLCQDRKLRPRLVTKL